MILFSRFKNYCWNESIIFDFSRQWRSNTDYDFAVIFALITRYAIIVDTTHSWSMRHHHTAAVVTHLRCLLHAHSAAFLEAIHLIVRLIYFHLMKEMVSW